MKSLSSLPAFFLAAASLCPVGTFAEEKTPKTPDSSAPVARDIDAKPLTEQQRKDKWRAILHEVFSHYKWPKAGGLSFSDEGRSVYPLTPNRLYYYADIETLSFGPMKGDFSFDPDECTLRVNENLPVKEAVSVITKYVDDNAPLVAATRGYGTDEKKIAIFLLTSPESMQEMRWNRIMGHYADNLGDVFYNTEESAIFLTDSPDFAAAGIREMKLSSDMEDGVLSIYDPAEKILILNAMESDEALCGSVHEMIKAAQQKAQPLPAPQP